MRRGRGQRRACARRTFSVSGSLLGEEPGYLPNPELVLKPAPYRTVKMEFSRGNLGEVLYLLSRTV